MILGRRTTDQGGGLSPPGGKEGSVVEVVRLSPGGQHLSPQLVGVLPAVAVANHHVHVVARVLGTGRGGGE